MWVSESVPMWVSESVSMWVWGEGLGVSSVGWGMGEYGGLWIGMEIGVGLDSRGRVGLGWVSGVLGEGERR